jgi:hypothetical protein
LSSQGIRLIQSSARPLSAPPNLFQCNKPRRPSLLRINHHRVCSKAQWPKFWLQRAPCRMSRRQLTNPSCRDWFPGTDPKRISIMPSKKSTTKSRPRQQARSQKLNTIQINEWINGSGSYTRKDCCQRGSPRGLNGCLVGLSSRMCTPLVSRP